MKIYDTDRELMTLKIAVGTIENFGAHFVAYNTKFLGYSDNDRFRINGHSSANAKHLKEFCFGYDDDNQLHLLHVYEIKTGLKFAATEIRMGLYAYWSVSLD